MDTATIIAALAQLPLPPAVSLGLDAALVLLPIIERAFGVVPLAPAIVSASPVTIASVMTPDQARVHLGLPRDNQGETARRSG